VLCALAFAFLADAQDATGLAAEQARIAARMVELEQRLLELTGRTDEGAPGNVERALRLSRERLIVANMERIRELVGRQRYAEAAELQEQVISDVTEVAAALAQERGGMELARLQELAGKLDGLIADQQAATGRTGRLAEGQYGAAAQAQEDIRRALRELLGQADAVPGEAELAAAAQQMMAASEALGSGRTAAAEEAQRGATDRLQDARTQVQKAIAALEAQLRSRRRAKLRELFRAMLSEQLSIGTETEVLHVTVGDAGAMSRAHRLQAAALAARERDLLVPAEEARLLLEADGTTAAMPVLLAQATDDVQVCADLLVDENVSPIVRELQADVGVALAALLEAVSAEPTEPAQEPDELAKPPEPGRKHVRLLAVAEELKLVRAVQARVNARTAAAPDRVPSTRLAENQARLAQMMRELQMALLQMKQGAAAGVFGQVAVAMDQAAGMLREARINHGLTDLQQDILGRLDALIAALKPSDGGGPMRTVTEDGPEGQRPSGATALPVKPADESVLSPAGWARGALRRSPGSADAWLPGLPPVEQQKVADTFNSGRLPPHYVELLRQYSKRLAEGEGG